jgi:hypothetical protein
MGDLTPSPSIGRGLPACGQRPHGTLRHALGAGGRAHHAGLALHLPERTVGRLHALPYRSRQPASLPNALPMTRIWSWHWSLKGRGRRVAPEPVVGMESEAGMPLRGSLPVISTIERWRRRTRGRAVERKACLYFFHAGPMISSASASYRRRCPAWWRTNCRAS